MKIVICVTVYHTRQRLYGFLNEIHKCYNFDQATLIIAQTDGDTSLFDPAGFPNLVNVVFTDVKREPTSIAFMKVEASKKYCDDDTIWMSVEDDYRMNPHILNFIKTVFEENPQIDYLSPMWYPGVSRSISNRDEWKHPHKRGRIEKLSGFDFAVSDSCIGGATIVRWQTFFPIISQFFKDNKISINNPGIGGFTWDQVFFKYLTEKTGNPQQVYTMMDFSLCQHCNMVSTVLDSRGSVLNHLYGQAYDPACNPFQLRDILVKEER